MEEDESAVSSDQLRITVELGDNYAPTPRVAAALNELAEAVRAEVYETDVEGFGLGSTDMSFKLGTSYLFDSVGAGKHVGLSVEKIPAPPAPFAPRPLP